MSHSMLIGIAASVFSTTSLIPQLVKLAREKKSGDLSLGMVLVLAIGLALWIYYGTLKADWIITLSNGCALLINIMVGILTIRYSDRNSFFRKHNHTT